MYRYPDFQVNCLRFGNVETHRFANLNAARAWLNDAIGVQYYEIVDRNDNVVEEKDI
ncbi:MAG: hypothetical protein J2P16_01135 [Mycobacterium sp.]|nr:hypothetical protein [Mycobacterium sp.]